MLASEQTTSGVTLKKNLELFRAWEEQEHQAPNLCSQLSGGKTGLSWTASSTPSPGLVSISAGLELLIHEGGTPAPTSPCGKGTWAVWLTLCACSCFTFGPGALASTPWWSREKAPKHLQAPLWHPGCLGLWMPYLSQQRMKGCWWRWGYWDVWNWVKAWTTG